MLQACRDGSDNQPNLTSASLQFYNCLFLNDLIIEKADVYIVILKFIAERLHGRGTVWWHRCPICFFFHIL